MSASLSGEMLPLLTHADCDAPIAFRGERCIDVKTFLADVAHLVALLPAGKHMLNVCADRYHFLVGLAASMCAGKICLLPSNQTPESVRQMRAFAADVFCLTDSTGRARFAAAALSRQGDRRSRAERRGRRCRFRISPPSKSSRMCLRRAPPACRSPTPKPGARWCAVSTPVPSA